MNGHKKEELKLPNIFELYGYKVYFWSNGNNEPVHVHISKGNPHGNATKIWLTKTGGCIIANNNSKIPKSDLTDIMKTISLNFLYSVDTAKEQTDIHIKATANVDNIYALFKSPIKTIIEAFKTGLN